MPWPKELIPDKANLFCRVHLSKIYHKQENRPPKPNAFVNSPPHGPDLSSDWDKYASAQESRDLISRLFKFGSTTEFKNKNEFYIYQMNVQKIRLLTPKQLVEHAPIENNPEIIGVPNNRAHAAIIGNKGDDNDTEIRLKFATLGSWAIAP